MPPQGLSRKFRLLFIIQILLVTLFIAGGLWAVMGGSIQVIFRGLLQEDAAYFWDQRQADPEARPTHSRRQDGALLGPDGTVLAGQPVPAPMRTLAPGFHDLKEAGWLVWVEERPAGRLVMRYERAHALRIIFLVVVLPALVTLLGFYLAAWYSYRMSRRLVAPVNWLAGQVVDWDPRQTAGNALDAPDLPPELVGETRQLAKALRNMARRVRDHIQREHEFTRDASHELRTPLTVIRMATDLALADPDLAPPQVRSLRRIQQASRDMESVLESQLILARDGDVEARRESVDVPRLLEEEAIHAREGLDGRPIRVELVVDDPGFHITTSAQALRVVVRQLLENACQYTLEGSIRIHLGQGWLTVTDTGIGMNEVQLERAFEPFYRGNPSEGAGSGLGLSIVRRLCKRFGWPLELHSQPRQGTRVRVGLVEVEDGAALG